MGASRKTAQMRSNRGVEDLGGSGGLEVRGEEAFAREAGKDGVAELMEFGEMVKQDEVAGAKLAEAEAGVEHDGVWRDARSGCLGESVAKTA